MSDNLGISVGAELMAAAFQPLAQSTIVFDNTVVDYGNATRAVDMRMGIVVIGRTMRSLARVGNAKGSGKVVAR